MFAIRCNPALREARGVGPVAEEGDDVPPRQGAGKLLDVLVAHAGPPRELTLPGR